MIRNIPVKNYEINYSRKTMAEINISKNSCAAAPFLIQPKQANYNTAKRVSQSYARPPRKQHPALAAQHSLVSSSSN